MSSKATSMFFWILIIILAVIGVLAYQQYAPSEDEGLEEEESSTPEEKDTFEHEMLKISQPLKDAQVTSPLTIEGEARGIMFFEASFTVTLEDENGKKLTEAPAQASGEWMTEDFVAFKAKLEFQKPTTEKGYLIFHKANPSGLPENDLAIKMPISFAY